MATEYYKVLGIDRSADHDGIRSAYRRISLKLHPDKNKSVEAKDAFGKIAEAYDVLSDPRKKAIYDQYGPKGLKNGVPPRNDGFQGFQGGYQFSGNSMEVFDNFFGGKNPFQDFFAGHIEPHAVDPKQITPPTSKPTTAESAGGRSLEKPRSGGGSAKVTKPDSAFGVKFGGLHGMSQSSQLEKPVQNPTLVRNVEVSLEDLYVGVVRKGKIMRKILNDDATTTSEKERVFLLDIQKGWRHGTKITFAKEGDQGCNRIAADVTFVLNEKPHDRFMRKGNDLHYKAEMSLLEALTGTILKIVTLDGRTLNIPINEVVSPTYRKIIQQEGMPFPKSPNRKGNLVIDFQLKFPTYFNKQQKDLLKQAFDAEAATKTSAARANGAKGANGGDRRGGDGEDEQEE